MKLNTLPAVYESWPIKKNCRIGIAGIEGVSKFVKVKQVAEKHFLIKKMVCLDFLLLLSTSKYDSINDYFPDIT